MTKEEFINDVSNWTSYRTLLWPALEITSGDVLELGMGHGSTPFLHQYCKDSNRRLFSFDNSFEWASKFDDLKTKDHEVIWVTDWDVVFRNHSKCDVVLIDHSPGERRKVDLKLFANTAKIIVIHDSEPAGWNASDYQVRSVIDEFKYVNDFKPGPLTPQGAWATAVSNFIDVTKFDLP